MDRRLASFLVLLTALPARAADEPGLAASVGQMLLGLGVVLGLLLATLWLLKRIASPRTASGNVRVLGATAVGPRERVVLVEVAGQVLVLGVAPGHISTLHSLHAQDLPAPAPGPGPAAADFQAKLRHILERRP